MVETGQARRIALVAQTPADVRDVMIEGESGLLNICPPWDMPVYEPSKRRLTWKNGARAITFSSYEPDQLRGPQFDLAWCDELRSWAYPQETWDNLMFGLRLGQHPRCVVTTTPAPIAIIRSLLKNPDAMVTRGSTYENRANLAPSFFKQIIAKYEGTTIGQQEIHAEVLEDIPGALWQRKNILYRPAPDMQRVVIGIDPAVSSSASSDETGIIAAGKGIDGMFYVMGDRSCRLSPAGWARRAIQAYKDFLGDRVIGEVNNGGDMVELTLRTFDSAISFKAVHASRGKVARAEPISALYEQHRVYHVKPFEELEDQLCNWTPESGKSPDRLDALVWALTELTENGEIAAVDIPVLKKRPEFSGIRGRSF
jgi:phage terminase large subunit-like protein